MSARRDTNPQLLLDEASEVCSRDVSPFKAPRGHYIFLEGEPPELWFTVSIEQRPFVVLCDHDKLH